MDQEKSVKTRVLDMEGKVSKAATDDRRQKQEMLQPKSVKTLVLGMEGKESKAPTDDWRKKQEMAQPKSVKSRVLHMEGKASTSAATDLTKSSATLLTEHVRPKQEMAQKKSVNTQVLDTEGKGVAVKTTGIEDIGTKTKVAINMSQAATYSIFKEPGCLIYSAGESGQLKVNTDILEQVEKIDGPLVVVAIAGKYRTGKSYLLNRLALAQRQDLRPKSNSIGFALGNTVQSKTKGIWIWARTHPEREGHYILIIDTEGLFDVEKDDADHDNWIFVLSLLLSSVFCYNQMGAIDRRALEDLSFVAHLAQQIKLGDTHDRQFDLIFPKFVYVLRDFNLQLEIDGKSVNPDQYLEHSLDRSKNKNQIKKNYDADSAQKQESTYAKKQDADSVKGQEADSAKKHIRKYFKSRRCFVFRHPVNNPDLLHNLENIEDKDIDQRFLEETKRFCNYIFKDDNVKTFKLCMPLTGRAWAQVVKEYVQHIREGKIPSVTDAFQSMLEIENGKLLDECFLQYQQALRAILLPCKTQELYSHHVSCLDSICKDFNKKCLYDENQIYMRKLFEKTGEEYENLKSQNQLLLKEKENVEKERQQKESAQEKNKYLEKKVHKVQSENQKEQALRKQAEHDKKIAEIEIKKVNDLIKQKEETLQREKQMAANNYAKLKEDALQREKKAANDFTKLKEETLKREKQNEETLQREKQKAANNFAKLKEEALQREKQNEETLQREKQKIAKLKEETLQREKQKTANELAKQRETKLKEENLQREKNDAINFAKQQKELADELEKLLKEAKEEEIERQEREKKSVQKIQEARQSEIKRLEKEGNHADAKEEKAKYDETKKSYAKYGVTALGVGAAVAATAVGIVGVLAPPIALGVGLAGAVVAGISSLFF